MGSSSLWRDVSEAPGGLTPDNEDRGAFGAEGKLLRHL